MKKSIFTFLLFLFILPFNAYSQQSIHLSSCTIVEYPINDHSDSNDNGVVCEAMITLTNSSSYADDEICQLSAINWVVIVDLNSDGIDDLEFSSELPTDDTDLDDTNGNGIPDLYIPMTSNNEEQNIELPEFIEGVSDHTVSWSVFDDCGLSDECNTSFIVRDKKSPTPFCVSLSSIEYDGTDTEIFAENFNVGVFDNCTDQEDIRISFSNDSIVPSRKISCDDALNSPVHVKVYFWDDSDNIDFCTVFLSVIAVQGADCYVEGKIAGTVLDWRGEPVEGAEINLDADIPDFPIITLTDANGEYSFGLQEEGLNYTLSASLDKDYLNGVSTLDLVMILRHMLGLQPFENPFQIIAGDINGDNAVKPNDLFMHRKLILGVITEIPTNTSWKFLRSDFEFTNPLNPFPELTSPNENPFIYEFDSIKNGGYDFTGIKVGDVSN